MRNKIFAAAGTLGALTATALIGLSMVEANAGTAPAEIADPKDELTGPEAGCFGECAELIWEEVDPSGIVELQMWRGGRPEPINDPETGEPVQQPREARAYVTERITTHEDVFTALDLAGGVSGRCPSVHVGTEVTYCIKRGAAVLNSAQIQCLKSCAKMLFPDLRRVERVALLAGPPKTIEITRGVDLSPHEYAACRSAVPPTCGRGQAE